MNSGSLAQMSHNSFGGPSALGMPMSGLASRRGGQSIKPLSIDAIKPGVDKDNSLVTPRTSRSHLLAGLRTAPKSATAATFPQSPTTATPVNQQVHNGVAGGMYGGGSDHAYNGPKTSLPRFAQSQTYNNTHNNAAAAAAVANYNQQHYTAEEILAPPEIQIDERDTSSVDADYAELVATNIYLAAQKQRLQQQLMSVQAAQQQFQTLSLGNGANSQQTLQQAAYQQMLYQQQQQQQQLLNSTGNVYAIVDPATGQQTLYVGQGNAQLNNHYVEQYNANLQQLQHLQLLQQQLQQQQLQQQQQQQQQQHQQQHQHQHQHQPQYQQQQHLHQPYQQQQQHRQASPITAPRVQVSPPPGEGASAYGGPRNPSPPRRFDVTVDQHTPLPPPSANAFRRGHKKSTSLVGSAASNLDASNASSATPAHEPPKSAGPKSTSFPSNVMQTGTYGPGQGRAGEHPVRQPRGPPSFDELARKPTSKHEDSKNFATRTRRSAVHNLMRAGFTRRQVFTVSSLSGNGSGNGSSGSISPISETAEDLATPLTDDESVSGHSGSGSLNGDDVECSLPSSRTSTGSWGAIGSERPGSREKGRKSTESLKDAAAASASDSETGPGSFASVFKSVAKPASTEGQRRAPMLVLSNAAEKRRFAA